MMWCCLFIGDCSKINVQEVLYRLRFPTFIEQAKQTFGIEVGFHASMVPQNGSSNGADVSALFCRVKSLWKRF